MKILAIRGKNLASLQGKFEIDFTQEPLSHAGIFAITGSTGAGKSTILDALCVALFDATPRTSKGIENLQITETQDRTINIRDSRNILRRERPKDMLRLISLHWMESTTVLTGM